MLDRILRTPRRIEKARNRVEKVGGELSDERAKITNFPLTQGAKDLADKKMAPLKTEFDKLDGEIVVDETLRVALCEGAGRLIASLVEGKRGVAVEAITGALASTGKNGRRTSLRSSEGSRTRWPRQR